MTKTQENRKLISFLASFSINCDDLSNNRPGFSLKLGPVIARFYKFAFFSYSYDFLCNKCHFFLFSNSTAKISCSLDCYILVTKMLNFAHISF